MIKTEERTNLWYAKFPPLTPWFGPEQDPVRPGVYMVDQGRDGSFVQPVFSFWDGSDWYPQGSLPNDAMKLICYGPIRCKFRQWRGLKESA